MTTSAPGGTDRVDSRSPEPTMPPGWPHDDALPIHGWGPPVDVSLDELWATFTDVSTWSRWNPCISWARIGDEELQPGTRLTWVFGPIKRWYPYRMPASATITEVIPGQRVTWEVSLPGFHAVHSYLFEDAGDGRSRFGSWEIARGPLYRISRPFWLAHFRYVCEASIAGANELADRRVRIIELGPEPSAASPAVVVLPDIDGRPAGIRPLADRLAADRRVLLVDYSGEIESSLAELADAIADLLPDGCDVVGRSFGTWIAAEIARRRPEAVRRVVLIEPSTYVRNVTTRLRAISTRLTPVWLRRRLVNGSGSPGSGSSERAAAADERSNIARRISWQLDRDATDQLAGIDQPVAAFLGGDGRITARRGHEARTASIFSRPGDRVVIADDDHETPIDSVADGVGDFLS